MLFRAPRLCGAVLLWLACAINPFLTCGTSLAFRVTAALYNGFVAWGMLVGPHVLAQTGIMWALSKVKPQYRTSTRWLCINVIAISGCLISLVTGAIDSTSDAHFRRILNCGPPTSVKGLRVAGYSGPNSSTWVLKFRISAGDAFAMIRRCRLTMLAGPPSRAWNRIFERLLEEKITPDGGWLCYARGDDSEVLRLFFHEDTEECLIQRSWER